jgi:hypothetical protein
MNMAYGMVGAMPLIILTHCILKTTPSVTDREKSFTENNDPFITTPYGNQIELTHRIVKLFGRRQTSVYGSTQNQERTRSAMNVVHEPKTSTATCTALIAVNTGMVALSSELVYRVYLPLLLCCFTDDRSLSLSYQRYCMDSFI